MAQHISIRRIGAPLPALCLLLILCLGCALIYLSIWGIPSSILRRIETRCAAQGIYLKVESAYLSYAAGLGLQVEDVDIYANLNSQPIIQIERGEIYLSLIKLITGEIQPDFIKIENSELHLLVSSKAKTVAQAEYLHVKKINLQANFDDHGRIRISKGRALLQDIPITLNGTLEFPKVKHQLIYGDNMQQELKLVEKFDLEKIIEPYQSNIDQCYTVIKEQKWDDSTRPELDFRINFKSPDNLRCTFKAKAPRISYRALHMKEVIADVSYNKNIILINKLYALDADNNSPILLQGGYDIAQRTLSFNLESRIPLIEIIKSINELEKHPLFSRISVSDKDEHSSLIEMRGDLQFSEDYLPTQLAIIGEIKQDKIKFNRAHIESIDLSFFYRDGDFFIDNALIQLDKGFIKAHAHLENGEGLANFSMEFPSEYGLAILEKLSDTPGAQILPDGLDIKGMLKLNIEAMMKAPKIKQDSENLLDNLPRIESITLRSHIGELSYKDICFESAAFQSFATGVYLNQEKRIHSIQSLQLKLTAEQIKKKATEDDKGYINTQKVNLALFLENCCINDQYQLESLSIAASELQLKLSSLMSNDAKLGESTLKIKSTSNITPFNHPQIKDLALRAHFDSKQSMLRDIQLGDISIKATKKSDEHINLHFNSLIKDSKHQPLSFQANWMPEQAVQVENIMLDLPSQQLYSILPEKLLESNHIKLLGDIKLKAGLRLLIEEGTPFFQSGYVNLNEFKLERESYKTFALRGKKNSINITTKANFDANANGSYDYKLNKLKIAHHSGKFLADITGNSARGLSIKGSSTIRLDYINEMIDVNGAHRIMRDFQFIPKSLCDVADLNCVINYEKELDIKATAKLSIDYLNYFLGSKIDNYDPYAKTMPVLEAGKEIESLRDDLGEVVHASVKQVTADLDLDILIDSDAANPADSIKTCRIALLNPNLTYDNSIWLKLQGIKNGELYSQLKGDNVIIDIGKDLVELNNIKGYAYPDYSVGIFYAPLRYFLRDLILQKPIYVETGRCVFPILVDCDVKMFAKIKIGSEDAFSYKAIGTKIPLSDFNGFIDLQDTYILLDDLNSVCWGGVANGAIKIDFSNIKQTVFDAYFKLDGVNITQLAKSYDRTITSGIGHGEIRLQAVGIGLEGLEAYGNLRVINSDLLNLSIFTPVSDLISHFPSYFERLNKAAEELNPADKPGFFKRQYLNLGYLAAKLVRSTSDALGETTNNIPGANYIIRYDLNDAKGDFLIKDGLISSNNFIAEGTNLSVDLKGNISLTNGELHLKLWPKVNSLISVAASPLTLLSNQLIDIDLKGPIKDPSWTIGLNSEVNGRKPIKRIKASSIPRAKKKSKAKH